MSTCKKFIEQEKSEEYYAKLEAFLENESVHKTIYPQQDRIFNAFDSTAFQKIKCVVVGQDPYFLEGLAHGLSFSVEKGVKPPRSLVNIYKEFNQNFDDFIIPEHGNFQDWTKEGVFLLNTVLTVEEGKAGSHRKKGWEILTSKALKRINDELENFVFLAWGKDAHKVCQIINQDKHLVIQTSHPSPLGARKSGKDFVSFLGSDCFKEANQYLIGNKKSPINWTFKS